MAASPLPAFLPPRLSVSVRPRTEPYLVEVMVPFPTGLRDAAVTAAMEVVSAFLRGQTLDGFSVATQSPDDDSPAVANTEFVQLVARTFATEVKAYADAVALIQIKDLLTQPKALSDILPTSLPDTPSTPWLNNGVLNITPPDTSNT